MPLTARFLPLEQPFFHVAAVADTLYGALGEGGLARLDIDRGTVTPLTGGFKDKWGSLVSFPGLAARGSELFLASIDDAWLARDAGGKLVSARKVAHKGDAMAVTVRVASDTSGEVCVVTAYKTLTRVPPAPGKPVSVKADRDTFWGVAVAPDGSVVANGRDSGRVELRDPVTLEVRQVLEGLKATVLSLAFSSDGRWLVGGDDTTRACLWDLQTGASWPLSGMAKIVRFAWRPDGRFWAVELTRHVALFDPAHPQGPVEDLYPDGLDTRYLTDAALLPDGRLVCVVEDRGVLIVEG